MKKFYYKITEVVDFKSVNSSIVILERQYKDPTMLLTVTAER